MTDTTAPAPAAPDNNLPTIASFLLESPLYDKIAVSDDQPSRWLLHSLREAPIQIDAHCIYCKRESVFKTLRSLSGTIGKRVDEDWMLKKGNWTVEVMCVRNPVHLYRYFIMLGANGLQKIGQLPSLEDIAGADIEKYRSQLKGGYFTELKMATGLASHGIGIGSFVYLRRIFERLIYQHHDELPSKIPDFGKMRMDEKIGALKEVLPPSLVANKATYAILSKGLHELDEKTCKQYFSVVRAAIIRILEQDYQAREHANAEAALSQELAKIASQIKS